MAEFIVDARALEVCEGFLRDILRAEFREINSRSDREVDKFCHGLAVSVLEAAGGLVRTHVQEASMALTTLYLSRSAQDPEAYEKELRHRFDVLLEALRKEGLRG